MFSAHRVVAIIGNQHKNGSHQWGYIARQHTKCLMVINFNGRHLYCPTLQMKTQKFKELVLELER